MKTLTITEQEYHELSNEYSGFCTNCGEINYGGHEPDARKYHCENCETNNSYGIEECLIMDILEITE